MKRIVSLALALLLLTCGGCFAEKARPSSIAADIPCSAPT